LSSKRSAKKEKEMKNLFKLFSSKDTSTKKAKDLEWELQLAKTKIIFQSEKLPDGSIVVVLKVAGAIDSNSAREFEDKIIGFYHQGIKNIILILPDLLYTNSTGLGIWVKITDKFQENGGDIRLVDVPEKVLKLFKMMGLLALWKIYKTEEQAFHSFYSGNTSP
jgi:anti-sigma B factor antagonist